MKFGDALVNMIGEFASMHRTPDFKTKSDAIPIRSPTNSPSSSPTPHNSNRRHSLNLAVGVSDELPPFSVKTRRNRRQSIAGTSTSEDAAEVAVAKRSIADKGRRQSEPAVRTQLGDSFRAKLARLRQNDSQRELRIEEDELNEMNFLNTPPKFSSHSSEHSEETKENSSTEAAFALQPPRNIAHHRGSIVCIADDFEVSILPRPPENK